MNHKHVNAAKMQVSQSAKQSALRKQAQADRGSAKFRGRDRHNGGTISNSGQPQR